MPHRHFALFVLLLCVLWLPIRPAAANEIPIRGKVTSGGQPLAKARVSLLPLEGRYATARSVFRAEAPQPVAETRSGADGGFHLAAPALGMWTVRVEAQDHVPVRFTLEPLLNAVDLPVVELERDAGLELRVVDAGGRPLAATVAVAAPPDSPRAMRWRPRGVRPPTAHAWSRARRIARCDEAGRVRLPAASGETVTVEVVASGFAAAKREARGGGTVSVTLAAGQARPLKVVDTRGARLPETAILPASGLLPLAVTDARGQATVRLSPGQALNLGLVDGDGHHGRHRLEPRTAPPADGPPAAGEARLETIVLETAARLDGRVIDRGSREPIPGALVWNPSGQGDAVTTDGTGHFALGISEDANVTVYAAAAGYAPGSGGEIHASRAGQGLTIALTPAATIGGRVVDEDDQAIPGVEITVRQQVDRRRGFFAGTGLVSWHTRTSRQGRFELAGLPAKARYQLQLRKDGFAPATETVEMLEPFERRLSLHFVLSAGRRGFGQVVEASDAPIAGASVRLMPADGGRRFRFARSEEPEEPALTDVRGRFEIPDLKTGRYDLAVEAEGFAPTTVPGVSVPEGTGAVDLGTVILSPGAVIEGRVLDVEKAPLDGVEIHAVEGAMPFFAAGTEPPDATTDGTGYFAVGDLPPGKQLSVFAHKPGFVAARVSGLTAPTTEPLEIVMQASTTVSGRVLDERRQPVADAEVALILEGGGFNAPRRAQTDVDGGFEIAEVVPGRVTLRAVAYGLQEQRLAGLEVGVEGLRDVELVLKAGATIAGTVRAPDATAVIGARVSVRGPGGGSRGGWALTDGDGRYRIEGIGVGLRSVTAEHEDYPRTAREYQVEPGDNRLDLTLGEGVELSGRVIDLGGVGMSGATVTLEPGGRSWRRPQTVSGADGTFRFQGVAPGSYTVVARKRDYAESRSAEALAVAGEPILGLEIRLTPGTTLTGEVRGVAFEDLARLMLFASNERGGHRGEVDYTGRYRIANLGPGEWSVRAEIPETGRQVTEMLTIEEGQTEAYLDLEFDTGGFLLSGRVTQGEEPVAGALVFVAGISVSAQGRGSTGQDGAFEIGNLKQGSYRITLWSDSGLRYEEELNLDGDRELLIELDTGRLAGFLVDALDRKPIDGARIALEALAETGGSGSGARRWQRSDSRGYFSLGEVTAGTWKVVASKSGYAPAEITVEVHAGVVIEDLAIEMTPSEGIVFEVVLPGGGPAEEVDAVVLSGGQRLLGGRYRTTDNGRVRITGVPAGGWELLLVAGDAAALALGVTAPGHLGRLRLQPGGTLEVRVEELGDDGVAATVELIGPDGRLYRSVNWGGRLITEVSLRNGRATVSNLAVGNWRVAVRTADGRSWSDVVLVTAGGTAEVRLR